MRENELGIEAEATMEAIQTMKLYPLIAFSILLSKSSLRSLYAVGLIWNVEPSEGSLKGLEML